MAEFPAMELFVKGAAEKILDDYEFNGKTIREWAMLLWSGDAVEVVRCKDCKHTENFYGAMCCPYYEDEPVAEEHFCSYGERREPDEGL